MSDDLISRQAAIYNLAGIAKNCARSDQQKALMGRCIYMIENMPFVQPEQKTGQWIMHISDLFPAESTMECSNCKHEQPLIIDDSYCPNCGAKMESENENDD